MKKTNNRGITLVELIIALAISAIVIGAVILLMSAGSRGYQSQEREVSLQIEAQSVINQIKNLVIEGNNISYTNNQLNIHHFDTDASTFDPYEVIWLDSTSSRLYLFHVTTSEEKTQMEDEIRSRSGLEDNLLGEYVTSFAVSPESLEFDRSGEKAALVTITLGMEYYDRSYDLTEDVKLRNRIVNHP